MSVVLYDGVVTTPRNLDQGARRSVPDACHPSMWPAGLPELIGFCICVVGMTGRSKNRLWRQPNNSIAPRKFPHGAIYEVSGALHLVARVDLRGDADGFAKSPSGPNARS